MWKEFIQNDKNKKGKEQPYYYCSTYINTKKCNKHYILESELDDIVIEVLNQYIKMICDVGKKIDDIVSYSRLEYDLEIKK